MSRLKLKVAESRALRISLLLFALELVGVAGLLGYAVIHAAVSDRGARTGVAIGYSAGAVAAAAIATFLVWLSARRAGGGVAGSG